MSENNQKLELEIENGWILAFNKSFGFNLEIRRDDNSDQEIESEPPVLIGETHRGQFKEYFGIVPFYKKIPRAVALYWNSDEEETKYNLIGFEYHSATRNSPPETEDFVIGEFDYFRKALHRVFMFLIEQKLSNCLESADESGRLDEEFGG